MGCLTATDYKQPKQILVEPTDNYIIEDTDKLIQSGTLTSGKWDKVNESCKRVYNPIGLSPTIHTCQGGNTEPKILIQEKTKNDLGVVVLGNYSPSNHNASRVVDSKGIAPTVMENHGTVTATVVKDKTDNEIPLYTNYKKLVETIEQNEMSLGEVKHMDLYNKNLTDNCGTLNDPCHNNNRLWDGLRIRKLTPKECFRLMGFADKDIECLIKNKISNTQLYKMAGNSIVVNVLVEIFKKLYTDILERKQLTIYDFI